MPIDTTRTQLAAFLRQNGDTLAIGRRTFTFIAFRSDGEAVYASLYGPRRSPFFAVLSNHDTVHSGPDAEAWAVMDGHPLFGRYVCGFAVRDGSITPPITPYPENQGGFHVR